MTVDHAPLWQWITRREAIRRRRAAGEDPPWTDDPILARYRFCNVRREDDRVTTWIRDHVRGPYAAHPHLWLMLCISRQINWPDTLAELIASDAWPVDETFSLYRMTQVLQERRARGAKVYTGAYVIPAPRRRGADKQAHVAQVVIGDLWRRRWEFRDLADGTCEALESAHARICQSDGWGTFLAYQAVVDMRFTPIMARAADVRTWAAAGPGTMRGLNRLHGRPLERRIAPGQALEEMLQIHALVEGETGVALDLSDVPNVLCETDKYLRVQRGEGEPRALYVHGRGC